MKRLFYTMLAVCLLVLLALPAGAAERDTAFSDQAEIRNGYAVQMLVELELIGGYKDGSFQPGAPITRAETAKLIA
ncbi:MAG: S-layer homology domain-containing protein, partial [Firmicutes bacterium]|nr:S-layer homology domain-containing protein [Bacillota bacterium]